MTYEFAGGYKIRNQGGAHFLTFTVEGWIDLFSRQLYRDILIKNMMYCQMNKELLVYAFVIMSNHVHVIWESKNCHLSDIIRDFKSYCTKNFIEAILTQTESRRDWLLHMFAYYARGTNKNKEYKIWTNDNHPEEILTERFLKTKLNYIHENPVRAGLVSKAEEYIYSSASNYIKGKGVMEIDYLF